MAPSIKDEARWDGVMLVSRDVGAHENPNLVLDGYQYCTIGEYQLAIMLKAGVDGRLHQPRAPGRNTATIVPHQLETARHRVRKGDGALAPSVQFVAGSSAHTHNCVNSGRRWVAGGGHLRPGQLQLDLPGHQRRLAGFGDGTRLESGPGARAMPGCGFVFGSHDHSAAGHRLAGRLQPAALILDGRLGTRIWGSVRGEFR